MADLDPEDEVAELLGEGESAGEVGQRRRGSRRENRRDSRRVGRRDRDRVRDRSGRGCRQHRIGSGKDHG